MKKIIALICIWGSIELIVYLVNYIMEAVPETEWHKLIKIGVYIIFYCLFGGALLAISVGLSKAVSALFPSKHPEMERRSKEVYDGLKKKSKFQQRLEEMRLKEEEKA